MSTGWLTTSYSMQLLYIASLFSARNRRRHLIQKRLKSESYRFIINVDCTSLLMSRTGAQVLLATLAIPIVPVASEIDRFLVVDYNLQDRSRRLSNLLRLTSPPTRASLLKELVRVDISIVTCTASSSIRVAMECCNALVLSYSNCTTCWR